MYISTRERKLEEKSVQLKIQYRNPKLQFLRKSSLPDVVIDGVLALKTGKISERKKDIWQLCAFWSPF